MAPQMDSSGIHGLLKQLTQTVQVIKKEEAKNEAELSEKVRDKINKEIGKKWNGMQMHHSLEKHAKKCKYVDEHDEPCQNGKKLADAFEECMKNAREKNIAKSLHGSIPLQGPKLWKLWALTDKEQYRQTQRDQCQVEVYSELQRIKMESIREEQLCQVKNLHPLMKLFLNTLLEHEEETRHYFLQWLRFLLNNVCRQQLPHLLHKYREKVFELETIQKEKNVSGENSCKTELQMLNKQMIDVSFGLEHLLREVGQIYEAVSAQGEVPQDQMQYLCLPDVAAELMTKGYPLELMDGDAAHVPISWVSAVLSRVNKLLDSSRLFVLSVLGVQSSGKSTLLNTVFGVRFSTSAGRCTRGAFMQLLPIHSSLREEYKCDYFLIVDTEGLRAPELADQAHKHDNELATFVTGLANVTIINLSGETAGDMYDILQTTVHAFLRMRRVKRNKSSCHFVHQNVAAINAGEKTLMGHMKLKEALDSNTQAAAKEEGLEDEYKHFTDIIDFDSQKHVFYFQNLWKGKPPMATINPEYSTDAQSLKLCLITHAKETYSTDLNVFQKHLQNLWKAILHENFVFSFRNTLEITAYNTLDGAYSKWSWEFKQEMMTWENKASNKMKSCSMSILPSVYGECCSELPMFVHSIQKKVEEKMNKFFEDSSQREIMINWKGETENRLKTLVRQLQEHAESHCKLLKANRDTLAKVDKMKEDYTNVILRSVQQTASQLERGKMSEKQLEEKFNATWIHCIYGIRHLQVHSEEVNVETDVQLCLTSFELLRPALPMVFSKIQSNPLGKRGLNLQLSVTKLHVKSRQVYKVRHIPWGSEFPITDGQEITDKLLEHQKDYIQQMKQMDYNPNLATDLLHKLFKEIANQSSHVVFAEEYKVDMALTVCGYAVVKFQEMVDNERKQNDPVEYLERKMKAPLLQIFKDEYKQIAWEITAASAVCDLLLHSVRKEVTTSLSQRIASNMKDAYDFLQTKPALKAKILLDIGDKLYEHSEGSFQDCLLYLINVEKSLHDWLERYTIQYCQDNFAQIASSEISRRVRLLEKDISKVSEKLSKPESEVKTREWLTVFHSLIQETGSIHLNVTELHQLGGVHQLKDVSRFTKEIKTGLEELEYNLTEEFKKMPLSEMDNWMKKPHHFLFEELAGCTVQCPFCKEQCDLTNPSHCPSHKHRVAMHRPVCLGSYRYARTEKMALSVCTANVGSDQTFQNRDTEHKPYPCKEYAKFYPEWSISADISLEASLYWKWLVGHYASEIAEAFEMKIIAIPNEWKKQRWRDVRENLKSTYNI